MRLLKRKSTPGARKFLASFAWWTGIGLIACLLAAYPAHRIALFIEDTKTQKYCGNWGLDAKLEDLMENGKIREAVLLMEEASRKHKTQWARNPPNKDHSIHWHNDGHFGYGYMFCTLHNAWETLGMNMPRGLRRYLESGPIYNDYGRPGLLHDPQKWKPLGDEMAASEVPIIRILGLWLLEDRERFIEETYRQVDSGDHSFRALSDLVSYQYDTDPNRSIKRLLISKPWPETWEEGYRGLLEDHRIWRIHRKAVSILNRGESLHEIAPKLIPVLAKLSDSPEFERNMRGVFRSASRQPCHGLRQRLNQGDIASVVEWLESACRNYLENRDLLGEDFLLLASQHKYRPILWQDKSYEMNMPLPLAQHLIEKPSCENELDRWRNLGRAMTDSKTPILRILGYRMLEEKEAFAAEVYREFDSGDSTYRSLNAATVFQHDTDHLRVIRRLLTFDTPSDDDLIPYREEDRIAMIYMLALGIVYNGAEVGEDAEAMRPLIREYASWPAPDLKSLRNIEHHTHQRMQRSQQAAMQELIEEGDTENLVRMMETACRNLRDARDKLGDEFMLFVEEINLYWAFRELSDAREAFYLNTPHLVLSHITRRTNNAPVFRSSDGSLSRYFDKSLPDNHRYWEEDENSILRAPEESQELVQKLSESQVPILRAIGFYLLGDRPGFIATVYEAHDAGDLSFSSLRHLIEERMDPRAGQTDNADD